MARSGWGDEPLREAPWVVIGFREGKIEYWGGVTGRGGDPLQFVDEHEANRRVEESKTYWMKSCERLSIFNAKTGQVIQVDRSAWPKL